MGKIVGKIVRKIVGKIVGKIVRKIVGLRAPFKGTSRQRVINCGQRKAQTNIEEIETPAVSGAKPEGRST